MRDRDNAKFDGSGTELDGNSGGPNNTDKIVITTIAFLLACCSLVFYYVLQMDRHAEVGGGGPGLSPRAVGVEMV